MVKIDKDGTIFFGDLMCLDEEGFGPIARELIQLQDRIKELEGIDKNVLKSDAEAKRDMYIAEIEEATKWVNDKDVPTDTLINQLKQLITVVVKHEVERVEDEYIESINNEPNT